MTQSTIQHVITQFSNVLFIMMDTIRFAICFTTVENVKCLLKPSFGDMIPFGEWDHVSCRRDQTSISGSLVCQKHVRTVSELCRGRELLSCFCCFFFFSFLQLNSEKLASGGVFCWCLLSMSWSCREQCTGKMAYYRRREQGEVAERREIFDEAPRVFLMRSNVRELLLSPITDGAVPHCCNQAKDITNGLN